jgi:hypothetical protein
MFEAQTMNKHDKRELAKRQKKPEFKKLYDKLMRLQFRISALSVTSQMPTARELQEGKSPTIRAISQPGQDPQEVIAEVTKFDRQVTYLAHRLSKFFPPPKRDYWEEILYALAFGGRGTVLRGSQGPIHRTQERAELFRKLKDTNPSLSQQAVARQAMERLHEQGKLEPEEQITEYDVSYAYQVMGWDWERANRIR